jgi:hypothetical protein
MHQKNHSDKEWKLFQFRFNMTSLKTFETENGHRYSSDLIKYNASNIKSFK